MFLQNVLKQLAFPIVGTKPAATALAVQPPGPAAVRRRLGGLGTALVLVLMLGLPLAARAFSSGDFSASRNVDFYGNYDSYTITNYSGPGGAVVIPATFLGYPVISIGSLAFGHMSDSNITSVTIPNSVTYIGAYAFSGCQNLTNVTIPDSVTYIAYDAFADCFHLPSVIIPDSVTNIIGDTFGDCTNLTSVIIPGSVTSIGNAAFDRCTSLTALYFLGNPPATPGGNIFGSGVSPTVYYLPGKTTGWGAKYSGAPARSVFQYTVSNGAAAITNFAASARYRWAFSELFVPATLGSYPVTRIGANALDNFTNLTDIIIPDSVTSLGTYAFENCPSLTAAYFLGNAPLNDGTVFQGDTYTTSYYMPGTTGWGATYGGTPTGPMFQYSVANGEATITNYSGPSSDLFLPAMLGSYPVTRIGDNVYNGNSGTSVTIPDGITSIGSGAFGDCSDLKSVTIPDSVTNIGEFAFVGCTSLANVTLGSGVTSIGAGAFVYCSSLARSVTIPQSVTSIGAYAFAYCSNLTAAYFQGNAPASDGNAFTEDSLTAYYLPGTTGWSPTYGGAPTVSWNPHILTHNGMFGIQANHFGFTFMGAANVHVAIQASSDLAHPNWVTVTNLICGTNGAVQFTDPAVVNSASRYYRFQPD